MPLKTYDTKESVPEAQRATAIETKDGKFVVEEVDTTLGDRGAAALEKERADRKKAEDARKLAEKERDELKLKVDAAAKGITEVELQKIRDAEAAKIKPIEEERDRLARENRQLKLTDRVKALALASGVMPDRIGKVMKDLEGRVDLTEDGNSIVVKDAEGKVTATTIENFLTTDYKKEAPFFYKGTGAAGSDSTGSEGGGGSGYDPVAAGKAKAKAQVGAREERAKGLT